MTTLTPMEESYQAEPKNQLPIDEPAAWKRLLNVLYLHNEDQLFKWAKDVRAAVCGEEGNNPTKPRRRTA